MIRFEFMTTKSEQCGSLSNSVYCLTISPCTHVALSHKRSACTALHSPAILKVFRMIGQLVTSHSYQLKVRKVQAIICAALSMCVYGIQGGLLARTCCNFLDKSTKNLNIDLPTSSACSQGLNYKLCPGTMTVDQSTSECCGWSTEVIMAYMI